MYFNRWLPTMIISCLACPSLWEPECLITLSSTCLFLFLSLHINVTYKNTES